MKVTRRQEKIIREAVSRWREDNVIDERMQQHLNAHLVRSPFDWQRLSRYAFWTALACLLIALGSLFADSDAIAWLVNLFSDSALARIALPTVIALACYGWGFRRQRRSAVALQHRGDAVYRRCVYRGGALAARRAAG